MPLLVTRLTALVALATFIILSNSLFQPVDLPSPLLQARVGFSGNESGSRWFSYAPDPIQNQDIQERPSLCKSNDFLLKLNSSARPILQRDHESQLFILTVVYDRLPSALQHNPYNAAVERWVRPVSSLVQILQPGRSSLDPISLLMDCGWQHVWSDRIQGAIEAVSGSEADGVIAIAYRRYLDEEIASHIRIYYREAVDHLIHVPVHANVPDVPEPNPFTLSSRDPILIDIPLRGNTRVTAISATAHQILYCRENDIRTFRVLKFVNGTWDVDDPGPFADRSYALSETLAVHLLYSVSVETILTIHVRGRANQLWNVVLNTYRRQPTTTTTTTTTNAPDTSSSWARSISYWERPLYLGVDEDDAPLMAEPILASSADNKAMLFSLGSLLIGLDYLPPSLSSQTSGDKPSQGFYQVNEVFSESVLHESVRHVSFSPDSSAVALGLEGGDVVVLRRDTYKPSHSQQDSSPPPPPPHTRPRSTHRLSDALLFVLSHFDLNATLSSYSPFPFPFPFPSLVASPPTVNGMPLPLDIQEEPYVHPWQKHVRVEGTNDAMIMTATIFEESLVVLHLDGSLSLYDLRHGMVTTISAVRSFVHARWKIVIAAIGMALYFLYSQFVLRSRSNNRTGPAARVHAPPPQQ
mmetsp:Transcript_40809/g.68187  ORF Transcript_40809/g.68187 Transcript_40809/m.68187 type:complete len:639 (-) Transcript_40809:720-2636(-)